MKMTTAMNALRRQDQDGLAFFSSTSLGTLFDETGPTLRSTIRSLVNAGILVRVARNLYHYAFSTQSTAHLAEEAAVFLRRGHYCFESLESAASKWGIISQVPIGRITVMTTGREGTFETPFGTVEFVHTSAAPDEIFENTVERPGCPLPIATKRYTAKNLRTCRRSVHLIDWKEVDDDQA